LPKKLIPILQPAAAQQAPTEITLYRRSGRSFALPCPGGIPDLSRLLPCVRCYDRGLLPWIKQDMGLWYAVSGFCDCDWGAWKKYQCEVPDSFGRRPRWAWFDDLPGSIPGKDWDWLNALQLAMEMRPASTPFPEWAR
jgi:hypothetical protein